MNKGERRLKTGERQVANGEERAWRRLPHNHGDPAGDGQGARSEQVRTPPCSPFAPSTPLRSPHTGAVRPALRASGFLLLASLILVGTAGAQTRTEFVPTFSTNARVVQQWHQMEKLAIAKSWDAWLGLYQKLVDDPRDLVLERDSEFLDGLRYLCHKKLAGLPAGVRQRYRALHDADARKLYEAALAEKDSGAMQELYRRFYHSSFATRALQWLAEWHLDRGRVEPARACYQRLCQEPDAVGSMVVRYALAASAAGAASDVRDAVGMLKGRFANQPVTLANRKVSGAAAAEQLAKDLRGPDAEGPGDWPAFAGSAGTRKMAGLPAGPLRMRWQYSLSAPPTSSPSRPSRVVFGGGYSSTRSRFSYLCFPARRGDQVWVQTPRSLVALNARTGAEQWNRADFTLTRDEAPAENQGGNSGYYTRSARTVQAAPMLAGPRLYTRLPMSLPGNDTSRWPADQAIAAFDARTGAPIWRRVALGEQRGIHFNVPLARGGLVFSGVASAKGGITEYSAVALDAGTGDPIWTTYLGAGSDPLALVDGSPPAIRDGLLWIETALYTLSAVDVITGDVRLIYRYPPNRRLGYRGGMDGAPQVTNEPISLIAGAKGPILFCPRWGADAVAIDPGTGRLVWSSPKASRGSTTGALIGTTDRFAFFSGDQIQAVHLNDGAREWIWDPDPSGGTLGYPALVGDRLYIPVGTQILVRSAADGREIETLELKDALGSSPGFTTVTVADDLVLVATQDRVVGFEGRK